jgi:hypothetical protein
MDTDSKLIWRFAAVGLSVSTLVFACMPFFDSLDGNFLTVLVVLCPPSLLVLFLSEAIKGKSLVYATWALIGLSNAGLYAVIGAAYVGLRKKSD